MFRLLHEIADQIHGTDFYYLTIKSILTDMAIVFSRYCFYVLFRYKIFSLLPPDEFVQMILARTEPHKQQSTGFTAELQSTESNAGIQKRKLIVTCFLYGCQQDTVTHWIWLNIFFSLFSMKSKRPIFLLLLLLLALIPIDSKHYYLRVSSHEQGQVTSMRHFWRSTGFW